MPSCARATVLLTACIREGHDRQMELFLHHKAGHRLPILVRVNPIRNAEGVIVGAVETFSDSYTKISALDKIVELEGLAFLRSGNRRRQPALRRGPAACIPGILRAIWLAFRGDVPGLGRVQEGERHIRT